MAKRSGGKPDRRPKIKFTRHVSPRTASRFNTPTMSRLGSRFTPGGRLRPAWATVKETHDDISVVVNTESPAFKAFLKGLGYAIGMKIAREMGLSGGREEKR